MNPAIPAHLPSLPRVAWRWLEGEEQQQKRYQAFAESEEPGGRVKSLENDLCCSPREPPGGAAGWEEGTVVCA